MVLKEKTLKFKGAFCLKSFEFHFKSINSDYHINNLENLFIDFSETTWIDLDILMYLICVLHSYKTRGVRIKIILPEGQSDNSGMPDNSKKIRDFLSRWKFFECLKTYIDPVIENLFFEKQHAMLSEKPANYERASLFNSVVGAQGVLSNRLLEMTPLTEIVDGMSKITFNSIEKYTAFLSDKLISNIFKEVTYLNDDGAKRLSESIIYEALENLVMHPDGSIAMIGMSKDFDKKWFYITVVDNGRSIPETIKEAYHQNNSIQKMGDVDLLPAVFDKELILYASQLGTSRFLDGRGNGKGLYYLKKDTVQLGGELLVRAGSAMVKFYNNNGKIEIDSAPATPFIGNLINIRLPYKAK